MFTLENETMLVTVAAKGAELTRIYNKQTNLEYLWDAQPEIWGKHSPVLFPIVGTLKENTFLYKGQSYQLSRHGFARDRAFEPIAQSAEQLSLQLQDDETTRAAFPFRFRFSITYQLSGNNLTVTYSVHNPDATEPLYFSVGGHPAFRLPLEPQLRYEDYTLYFNETENAGRWPITAAGLIGQNPEPLLNNTNELPLSKSLFAKDALVLKNLVSEKVEVRSASSDHGISFSFPGFPYLGLWAAPGADFLCIEPWCGIADSVEHTQNLEAKEGIIHLAAGASFAAAWSARFF